MKIVLGLSGITEEKDLVPLIEEGADEFFVGYVPKEWSDKYGFRVCPNRRPFRDYNYLSEDDLVKICSLVHKFGKKIFFALNEHEYDSDRMAMALDMLKLAENIGFDAAIVSNLALMLEARAKGIKIPFTLSTGVGALSGEVIDFYRRHVPGITRVILPRSLTVQEIRDIVLSQKGSGLSFEVFGMSDQCPFNDEYCLAWHTEGLGAFCGFLLCSVCDISPVIKGDWKKKIMSRSREEMLSDYHASRSSIMEETGKLQASPGGYIIKDPHASFLAFGVSICGLCSMKLFKEWGIDAVKVPSRGDNRKRGEVIHLMRAAMKGDLNIEECQALIGDSSFCSGRSCYYNYPFEKI